MTYENTISTTKTTSRIAARAALVAAVAVAALGFTASDASATPKKVKFGSKLTKNTQPSNSLPAHTCPNANAVCTWIQREGYHPGFTNPDAAPKSGVIKKIKVIAGGPGEFRPLLARVKEGGPLGYKAKLKYRGPVLEHEGQTGNAPYEIEKYKVNIPVKKGMHLGIEATSTSMVRCSSGGPNTLQYQPTLALGGPFASPHDTTGCWLLIEAKVKPS